MIPQGWKRDSHWEGLAVYEKCIRSLQLLFDAADATWRDEIRKDLGRIPSSSELIASAKTCGEAGTLLRTAFDVRESALMRLREATEIPPINGDRSAPVSQTAHVAEHDLGHEELDRSLPQARIRIRR